MITILYKLPAWFASPDDKPSKELLNLWLSRDTAFVVSETPDFPDSETIMVQTSINSDSMINAMEYNFIRYADTWYVITKAELKQASPNVWIFTGTMDIYLTWLVDFFSETNAINKTQTQLVFFKQKHVNRFVWNETTNKNGWYGIQYEIQQYLLNQHPALNGIDKRPVKSTYVPTLNNPTNSNYYTNNLYENGSKNYDVLINNGTTTFNFYWEGSGTLETATITYAGNGATPLNTYTPQPVFIDNSVSAYPIMIAKQNKNMILGMGDNMNGVIPYVFYDFNALTPYNSSLEQGAVNFTITYDNKSDTFEFIPRCSLAYADLYNIPADDYMGVYILPLPTTQWIPISMGDIMHFIPFSSVVNAPFLDALSPLHLNVPKGNATTLSLALENMNITPLQLTVGFVPSNNTWQCLSNQGTSPFNLAVQPGDLSNMEPALMNWYRVNVRMYGQDNLINPTNFNYKCLSYFDSTINNGDNLMAPTDPQYAILQLMNYLTSFQITISPPNIMVTNIPWVDLYPAYSSTGTLYQYTDNYTQPLFHGELNLPTDAWNYNSQSDIIFSFVVNSDIPTPSTAWSNYIANNKNNYDTALNISYLMAEQAQQNINVVKQGYMGTIGSLLNPISDLTGLINGGTIQKGFRAQAERIEATQIAPESYAEQADKYNYLAYGKEQDMTRVSNMRVSSTSSLNVENNVEYCMVAEVPPLYEQIAVVNYYALNGYLVDKWVPWCMWYNRRLCNFVSCAMFSNAMIPNISTVWKGKVDELMNKGFRVWSSNNYNQEDWTVPYDNVLLLSENQNNYSNWELHPQDDQEINFMCGAWNEKS